MLQANTPDTSQRSSNCLVMVEITGCDGFLIKAGY
jgi:hypothetical protein